MSSSTPSLTPTFHPFPRLPLELQRQIFLDVFTFPNSIIVTAAHVDASGFFIDDEEPYTALLSTLYHLSQQTHHPALPQLLPTISVVLKADLDFYLSVGWMDEEPIPFENEITIKLPSHCPSPKTFRTHFHEKIVLPIVATVYLRVDHDILCLPSLNGIDISHFLSCPKHQALKFIAVREHCLTEGSASNLVQVFSGLKNLEIVYVVERSHQWPRLTLSELEKERVKKFKHEIKRVWHRYARGMTWRKELEEEPVFLIKTLITDS
jgi:hypothetical protein